MAVLGYTVRCYREMPGDAACHDVPAFGETIDETITLGGQMLLAYAKNTKRPPEAPPTRADLVDQGGSVVARIRVAGPDTVERIQVGPLREYGDAHDERTDYLDGST